MELGRKSIFLIKYITAFLKSILKQNNHHYIKGLKKKS